jgi:hypothetical protein
MKRTKKQNRTNRTTKLPSRQLGVLESAWEILGVMLSRIKLTKRVVIMRLADGMGRRLWGLLFAVFLCLLPIFGGKFEAVFECVLATAVSAKTFAFATSLFLI